MTDSHKDSVLRAMNKYSANQLKEPGYTGRRNKKPEKLVESAVLAWAKPRPVFLHVVDSSTYDHNTGEKHAQKVEVNFLDMTGNDGMGNSMWVELKAKGKRSRLSDGQRLFIKRKIEQNCFAVVVDSADLLHEYYTTFLMYDDLELRKQYLRSILPKEKAQRAVDDELGF
jgi:hypothetical protein